MDWIGAILNRRKADRQDLREFRATASGGTIPELKGYPEQLIAYPSVHTGTKMPRFKLSSADQLNREAQTTFGEMRVRLNSAFAAAQPVTDARSFAGRSDVVQSLIRAIEDLRVHVVLYGERGLGKTSCLHMLTNLAREAGYLVVYISCGTKSTFEEVTRCAAAQVPLLYYRGVSPASAEVEAGKTFASRLPVEPFSSQAASEVLTSIVDTRVLVILDEFDQPLSRDFRISVAELLKNLSDRAARVQFLIGGVAANLTELIAHVPSIQRNIFAIQLERMSAPELRDLIRNGEVICGLHFEPEAAEQIIDAAQGLPYFARLLASYAGLRALADERSLVNVADVIGAIEDVAQQFAGRISDKSMKQLDHLAGAGSLEHLSTLAGLAQKKGGAFTLADIEATIADEKRASECRRLVQSLSSENTFVGQDAEREAGTFRFLDDTTLPYIWFRGVFEKLRGRPDRETTQTIIAGVAGGLK